MRSCGKCSVHKLAVNRVARDSNAVFASHAFADAPGAAREEPVCQEPLQLIRRTPSPVLMPMKNPRDAEPS